jgi:regulatory protein
MPTITRLVAGKLNSNRVNLYFDNHFGMALSLDEVVKHGLKRGQELTETEVEALRVLDDQTKLYAKILNFISYRPRSVKEVRDRLIHYNVKVAAEQDLLIDRLKSQGYLDDLKFSQWYVDSRNTHKLRSPRALQAELASKGISRDVQDQVLPLANDSRTTILAILSKKLGSPRSLSLEEKQKIYAFLSRQGFPWEEIKQVVKSWQEE